MSVTVRPYKQKLGVWEVDIRLRWPDGTQYREKKKAPVSAKSGAKSWGEARESFLLRHGPPRPPKEVPTFAEFAETFRERHVVANRRKPSTRASIRSITEHYLTPRFGAQRLDTITTEQVQHLKGSLGDRAPKTVNNVLIVLRSMLKRAVEWGMLDHLPCVIRPLPVPKVEVGFHDADDYAALIRTSQQFGSESEVIVLLGGEAGLRLGEIAALEWRDVQFTIGKHGELHIQRAEWRGEISTTKGNRSRRVAMTPQLAAALQRHRHTHGPRVLADEKGHPLSYKAVADRVRRAAREAGLERQGVHILRHTFCSRLSMLGAPLIAIKELAGHRSVTTTQRYMHATDKLLEDAIQLLAAAHGSGDIGETTKTEDIKLLTG